MTSTLPQRLRTKADMINMGERITWGSETALMDDAADYIEQMEQNAVQAVEQMPLVRVMTVYELISIIQPHSYTRDIAEAIASLGVIKVDG